MQSYSCASARRLLHEDSRNILLLMQYTNDIHAVRTFEVENQIRKAFKDRKAQPRDVRIPDHRDRDFRANVTGDSGRS